MLVILIGKHESLTIFAQEKTCLVGGYFNSTHGQRNTSPKSILKHKFIAVS